MFDGRRSLERLLFFVALISLPLFGQPPATTTVSDTVYRGDGSAASGTLLISWPAFTTADNKAVGAGGKSVILGSGGALSVALVPNAGATPSSALYTVVYHLDGGTVKTEYWVVPSSSPASLAAVRATLGEGGASTPLASRQYVDTSVAAKASDTAVVHKAGSEAIAGVKAFSSSPSVPAPTLSTDVANKAYVDSALGTVGAGVFISKTGDTMSGPLVLSGDPTAANSAANRHYVDTGLASKADVVSGLVPRAELGSGTANSTVCLKGDGSWGACGTSSNAVSIQSVGVDTATPTDNQVLTYDASSGLYKPKPGGGVTAGMQIVKYAIDFNWSQSPAADLSTAGAKTVSLANCPAGVTGTELQYWVYVAGTGTAEAVAVTGGTCASNGSAGTLQFTTVNAHSAGYSVGSASGGLQEALIAARVGATNPTATAQGGKVVAPPGELKLYARVSVRTSDITVDFSGSIVECYMTDVCLFVGDSSNSTAFFDITLQNPRGRPTVANGQSPFIEVNAQKTRLFNVATRVPLSGGTFGSYVKVDDDQAFLLDGLDTSLGASTGTRGVRCDSTVCNPIIYAPGPFNTNSAVGWLKHLNLSLGACTANGIDWESGNTLHISDSVIQGFALYGIKLGGNGGSFHNNNIDNVYMEAAPPTCNPLGNIGSAGIVSLGQGVTVNGSWSGGQPAPVGVFPSFANTGTTQYSYYIAVHDSVLGVSAPFYAGSALSNGSGNITVSFPCVASSNTITYDLLRTTWVSSNADGNPAPYGTGAFAAATGITQGSGSVCTATDTNATLASYTVATPSFYPRLDYWPGNVVLSASSNTNVPTSMAHLRWNGEFSGGVISAAGGVVPTVFADKCYPWNYTNPIWVACESGDSAGNNNPRVGASVKQIGIASNGATGGYKGREIFEISGTSGVTMPAVDLYTLGDSNAQKTLSSPMHRPTWDANDTAIGLDQSTAKVPSAYQLGFRSPVSISNYVGSVFDNTSWKERLTSALKEFKTDVQVDANLTVSGGITGVISTAGALAATPSQCSGSFATGIQANGNANCTTADVIQLAETTPPTGIANFGIFWFDQTCHCPKVISNAGAAVQLGLTNVFNVDANTLEEYNGTTAQTFNVYGTRTDGSNYERMRLGYDTTDGYFLLASEAAGTGSQHGLGFLLQGVKRWVIDSSFNFKPWSDNLRDLGSPTLRPKHVYAGTYLDTTTGSTVSDVTNDGSTGTVLNKLAKMTGAPSAAVATATTDTSGVIGVVVDGAGTTGNAQVARGGLASCVFDGATTAGDYVQISSTTAGACHDSGAGYPVSGQVVGRVLSTNGSAGTYSVVMSGPDVIAPATASVTLTSGTYLVGNGTSAVNVSGHLFDNGSNAIDVRNGSNIQTVYTYGTFTDSSNYERLAQGYVSGDGYFEVLPQKAGTGVQRGIALGGTGTAGWAIDTTNVLKPFSDNSKDFGTASLRPRDVYVGRNLIMSSTVSTYNGKATAGTGIAPIYGAVSSTAQTAAISTTNLCATSSCGAGQYVVNYYVDSAVSCATAGSAALTLTIGWTDEIGAKTLQVPLNGTGVSGGNTLALGSTSNFGSGDISLWSAGSAAISYSTAYVACTSGTGTYAVRMTARQVQ